MLEVRFHEAVSEIGQAAWDALAGPTANPFVSYAWLDALERTGCIEPDRGWLSQPISVHESGELVAVAPAYVKGNGEGEFVFDHAWAELSVRLRRRYYPKLILAVPFTPATGPRLLVRDDARRDEVTAAVADALRGVIDDGQISSAHVLFPDEREGGAWERAGLIERLGLQYQWQNEGWPDWTAFLGRFDAKRRHQLKRERGALATQGISIETLRGDAIDDEAMDAMWRYYLGTVDKFVWGRQYLNRAFFEAIRGDLRDHVELVLARDAARKPLAGALNVVGGNVLYGRYWGTEVDVPFLHFNVCYYHSIDECLRRGIARFEPGAGGEHKRVRGFEPTATRSLHLLGEPRLDRVVRAYVARERELIDAELVAARTARLKTTAPART